jgi:hypothetical protein
VPRGELDRNEQVAGQIVAQQLGGQECARDVVGAPEKTHDLDVNVPGDRTVALEVTSAGDRALKKLREMLLFEVWEAPSLRHHWWLGVDERPAPHVKTLMRKIVPHLAVLERNDVGQVSKLEPLSVDAAPEVVAATRAIFELRAHRATRIDPPKDGEAARLLSSVGAGRSAGVGSLNGIVERCAAKKVGKLRAADGDQKHLFIWLRAAAYEEVELATATLASPDSPPTLPAGIDVVWVATGPTTQDALFGQLWRLEPPGGWETIDP